MRLESTSRLAPWLAALATLAAGVASWPYTVDDAFIVARYATFRVAWIAMLEDDRRWMAVGPRRRRASRCSSLP